MPDLKTTSIAIFVAAATAHVHAAAVDVCDLLGTAIRPFELAAAGVSVDELRQAAADTKVNDAYGELSKTLAQLDSAVAAQDAPRVRETSRKADVARHALREVLIEHLTESLPATDQVILRRLASDGSVSGLPVAYRILELDSTERASLSLALAKRTAENDVLALRITPLPEESSGLDRRLTYEERELLSKAESDPLARLVSERLSADLPYLLATLQSECRTRN